MVTTRSSCVTFRRGADNTMLAKLTRTALQYAMLSGVVLVTDSTVAPDTPRRMLPGTEASPVPVHFSFRSIPFSLDSSETAEKHAPETMAGGVAVFDYDNDGKLDIFFTNGADIYSLKKTSPKYWNRLFHNNGDGTFTDVTEKAGLAGSGY